MSYFFTAYETTRSKAKDTSLCPIAPGRYIICKDSGDVFYDTEDGVRKQLTDIIDLETDADRTTILVPLDKIYFVKSTGHFWRHLSGKWVNLSNVAVGISTAPYTKTFDASEWVDGKMTIPASEHNLALESGCVLAKIYMLKNEEYIDGVLAVMDTNISTDVDKSVILSYGGIAYSGKIILID